MTFIFGKSERGFGCDPPVRLRPVKPEGSRKWHLVVEDNDGLWRWGSAAKQSICGVNCNQNGEIQRQEELAESLRHTGYLLSEDLSRIPPEQICADCVGFDGVKVEAE